MKITMEQKYHLLSLFPSAKQTNLGSPPQKKTGVSFWRCGSSESCERCYFFFQGASDPSSGLRDLEIGSDLKCGIIANKNAEI